MDRLWKTFRSKVENTDTRMIRREVTRRSTLFLWNSGQGRALNAFPRLFGTQLVLLIPHKNIRLPMRCFERNGDYYALLMPEDQSAVRNALAENSAVEIWLANGWYSASAVILPLTDREQLFAELTVGEVYGEIGSRFPQQASDRLEVIRIVRNAPRAGDKGPGSGSWIWPLISGILFGMLLRKKK